MALGGGGNILGLIFKIGVKDADKSKEEIRNLRAEFQKEVRDIKSSGTDAFLSLGQSVGASTEQMAVFRTGALAAVGAVTAVAGAVTAASIAIFELTKKTADYGEEIWRAHEKTGISVETISALKVAGDQVGVSLNTLSTGLVRFTTNLAQADAGNKKFVYEFGQLGVKSFKDNDKALSEFLDHFATLRTDQERTLAASQAFGVRMGASFVEMFNDIGGNMDAFKDKLRDLGLLLDTEQAKESHEFEVMYKQVSQQLAALTRQIGFQAMPIIGGFFKAVSDDLKSNQSDWKFWGEIIQNVIGGVLTAVLGMAKFIHEAFGSVAGIIRTTFDLFSGPVGVADLFVRIFGPGGAFDRAGAQLAQAVDAFKSGTSGSMTGGTTDFSLPPGKTKKNLQPKKDFEAEIAELRAQIQQKESLYREEVEAAKAGYAEQLEAFSEMIADERVAAQQRLDGILELLKKEEDETRKTLLTGIITQDEFVKKKADIDERAAVARNQKRVANEKLDAEAYKHEQALLRDHNAAMEQMAQQRDADAISDLARLRDINLEDANRQIGDQRKLIAKKLQLELDYNSQVEKIRIEAIDRQETALTEEVNQIAQHYAEIHKITIEEAFDSKTVTDASKERADKVAALEEQRSRVIKAASDANIKAYRDEKQELIDYLFYLDQLSAEGATRPSRADDKGNLWKNFADNARAAAKSVQNSAMSMRASFGTMASFAMDALGGIAKGLGDMVGQWVEMGSQADVSMRKMVAAVLAGVSSQAATMAVMSFAYGLLALTPWGAPLFGPAPLDFQAAALFAGIAATTAIAGRMVAGSSFQNNKAPTTGAGSSGAGGGSTAAGGSTTLADINVNRFQAVPQVVELHVNVKRDAGSIVDVVAKDYQKNGPLRQLIVKDGVTSRS